MAAVLSMLRVVPLASAERKFFHTTLFRRRVPFSASFSAAPVTSDFMPEASRIELELNQTVIKDRELAIVQPSDVDQVLNMYITKGRLGGDPYWCRIWPSAIVLAEEVLENSELVADSHICDLGSGLGLAGLAAAVSGAKEVVFYDQEPLALLCSLLAVHVNIPHAITNLPQILELVCIGDMTEYIEYLACGLALSPEIFYVQGGKQDSALTARAEVFDWSKKGVHAKTFDMVLGCDILYQKDSVHYLADLLPRLIHQRGCGKVIMTDPTKRTPQHRNDFLNLVTCDTGVQGLKLEKIFRKKGTLNGKSDDVELMHFTSN